MDTSENWNRLLCCARLFMGLHAMEPLLLPHLRVKITRSTEKKIYFSIHAMGSTKAEYSTTIKAKDITSELQYNKLLTIIWQEVNARKLTLASNSEKKQ